MTPLAHRLGLSKSLAFHDVLSIDNPDLLAIIPRPALALIVLTPWTDIHQNANRAEDADKSAYEGSGPDEPVLWFAQTIKNACGLMACIHALSNGPVRDFIAEGSELDKLLKATVDLKTKERSEVLYNSEAFEAAHGTVAKMGDSTVPDPENWEDDHAFLAFVRGNDGHLWEMDGSRKGPLDRGALGEEEDALSSAFLARSVRPLLDRENGEGGDIEFSVTVLAPALDDD